MTIQWLDETEPALRHPRKRAETRRDIIWGCIGNLKVEEVTSFASERLYIWQQRILRTHLFALTCICFMLIRGTHSFGDTCVRSVVGSTSGQWRAITCNYGYILLYPFFFLLSATVGPNTSHSICNLHLRGCFLIVHRPLTSSQSWAQFLLQYTNLLIPTSKTMKHILCFSPACVSCPLSFLPQARVVPDWWLDDRW